MKQTIYIDVLISINLFINYFLLLTVSKMLNLVIVRKRLVLAAFIGSLYSLIILLPTLNVFLSLLIKLIMSASIVFFGFELPSLKMFLKVITAFFGINFLFGGIIFCLWYFATPTGIFINNNTVYLNISPLFLLFATFIAYLTISVMNKFACIDKSFLRDCQVLIRVNNKSVALKAKVDTANTLKEPFSNLPVVVAKYEFVCSVVPEALEENFLLHKNVSWPQINAKKGSRNIRLVPFKTISGEGLLPAFKANFVEVNGVKKDAYVAVCSEKIFNNEYQALIGTELID